MTLSLTDTDTVTVWRWRCRWLVHNQLGVINVFLKIDVIIVVQTCSNSYIVDVLSIYICIIDLNLQRPIAAYVLFDQHGAVANRDFLYDS